MFSSEKNMARLPLFKKGALTLENMHDINAPRFGVSKQNMNLPIINDRNDTKIVAYWLFLMAILVGMMVIIGGITRLTGSGLSMAEWRPLIGTLPPLNNQEWIRVFELYKNTPEYQQLNFGMQMGEFKQIFFWEYFHRLWGRLLGIVYVLPLIYFFVQRRIPLGYPLPLIGLALAGGFQGVVGWWMVVSGLSAEPTVSQYRLAIHLSIALGIFVCLVWMAHSLSAGKSKLKFGVPTFIFALIFVTIIAGAFVAGMDAGLLYNHYPLMGDGFVPVEYGEKGLFDPFENPASAQFHHRWIALFATAGVIYLWRHALSLRIAVRRANLMIIIVFGQFVLGILTLINAAPVPLGAMHQTGALLLLAASLSVIHCLYRETP